MHYIKIVFFVTSLLVLVQAQSNEDNFGNGLNATKLIITESIDEIVLTLNNYATSFVEFIINIEKSVSSFVQQVQVNGKPFTNLTEFKKFIHDLEHIRSLNASCLIVENLATYNLLNITEQKIARCLNNINPLTQEVNTLFSNLLQQIISTISNIVQNISNCILNKNNPNMLIELPGCLASNIIALSTEFGSVSTQLTSTLSTTLQHIGGVTNATTVCLNGVAHDCLKKALGVITNFAICRYNS